MVSTPSRMRGCQAKALALMLQHVQLLRLTKPGFPSDTLRAHVGQRPWVQLHVQPGRAPVA